LQRRATITGPMPTRNPVARNVALAKRLITPSAKTHLSESSAKGTLSSPGLVQTLQLDLLNKEKNNALPMTGSEMVELFSNISLLTGKHDV